MSEIEHRYGTVLVTGGAGFIGCALSQVLAPRCRRYIVLDNLHPQVHETRSRPRRLHPDAHLHVGDVTSSEDWDRILGDAPPDVIVHLAAETGTGQSLTESTRHAMVNVVGTTQMVDALHRHGLSPARILLASSRAVYGEGQWQRSSGETFYPGPRTHEQLVAGEWDFAGASPVPSDAGRTAANPTSVYGATKLAQEHVLRAWTAAHSVALSILRLQNVYGPGQSLGNPYTGIVVLFARMARAGQSIPLYEDGAVTRDFVHVDDVVDAMGAAIGAPSGSHLLDVGTGRAVTIESVAGILRRMYDAPPPTVTGRFRDGDVRHARCLIERTNAELGWTPRIPLDDGLRSLRPWVEGVSGGTLTEG